MSHQKKFDFSTTEVEEKIKTISGLEG